MNKNLYDKTFDIPKHLLDALKEKFNVHKDNEDSQGYKRNKELRKEKKATYQSLKRIKNFFDKTEKKDNEVEYELNGGDEMKKFVEYTLNSQRVYSKSKNKRREDSGVNLIKGSNFSNDLRPSKSHRTGVDKHFPRLSEQIDRINKLINEINYGRTN
jgi:hypothetical protein